MANRIYLARPAGDNQTQGRLGSSIKDIVATMILARVLNWSFVPPLTPQHKSDHRAFCYRGSCVSDVMNFKWQWLALNWLDVTTLRQQQMCPSGWVQVVLDSSSFNGFVTSESAIATVLQAVPPSVQRSGGCVLTTRCFRFAHPGQLLAWERQGILPAGIYGRVLSDLRRSLRPPPLLQMPAPEGRHAILAVHVRRGDRAELEMLFDPSSLVAERVRHASAALLQSSLFDRVSAFVVVEPGNSEDVFAHGCPREMSGLSMQSCKVVSASMQHDFQALVRSTLMVVSSSGFSTGAHLFRLDSAPTLVVGFVKHFFSADAQPSNLITIGADDGVGKLKDICVNCDVWCAHHEMCVSNANSYVATLKLLLTDEARIQKTSEALRRILGLMRENKPYEHKARSSKVQP